MIMNITDTIIENPHEEKVRKNTDIDWKSKKGKQMVHKRPNN